MFQLKVYGDVPPVGLAVADPVEFPKQLTFVCAEIRAVRAVGCPTSTVVSFVQLLVATTCTVLVPAVNPVNITEPPLALMVWVIPLTVTAYGATPPLTVTVTVPSEPLLQEADVAVGDTVKPALNDTAIGGTKSSSGELEVVEFLVRTKTFLISMPAHGSTATCISLVTSIDISTN